MRKTDVLFLVCVCVCAAGFVVRSLSLSVPLVTNPGGVQPAAVGVAGQSREVDIDRIRSLLNDRKLSDREAEFYEPQRQPEPGREP